MKQKSRGITLIALIITIIVLLILAGVTIATLTGEDGILNKANVAKEENQEKTATEIINLKITNIQLQSYKEEEKMPDLQYLADRLYEDNEIQYIYNESQKNANTKKEKITVTGNSIFIKLTNYPYEFEIDGFLRLASVNGVKVPESNSESDSIKQLQQEVSELKVTVENLQNAYKKIGELETTVKLLQNSSKTILLEKRATVTSTTLVANQWNLLEEVSLANYGTGKAIISFLASNGATKTDNMDIEVAVDSVTVATDRGNSSTASEWLKGSATATISYNSNTKILFRTFVGTALKPIYGYSILLIPD